ncbi:hypothetical protein BDR06DRAFT_952230 [Suillus hirtellus]|nr:hypothetical protein BDR06DRAFT_952230 [Suillus hirtellus]
MSPTAQTCPQTLRRSLRRLNTDRPFPTCSRTRKVHCFALFVVSFASFSCRTLDRYISSSLPDIGLGNLLLKLSSYSLEAHLRNLPSSTRNCMSKAHPPNAFEITFATTRSTLHRGLQQDGARQLVLLLFVKS